MYFNLKKISPLLSIKLSVVIYILAMLNSAFFFYGVYKIYKPYGIALAACAIVVYFIAFYYFRGYSRILNNRDNNYERFLVSFVRLSWIRVLVTYLPLAIIIAAIIGLKFAEAFPLALIFYYALVYLPFYVFDVLNSIFVRTIILPRIDDENLIAKYFVTDDDNTEEAE